SFWKYYYVNVFRPILPKLGNIVVMMLSSGTDFPTKGEWRFRPHNAAQHAVCSTGHKGSLRKRSASPCGRYRILKMAAARRLPSCAARSSRLSRRRESSSCPRTGYARKTAYDGDRAGAFEY